MHEWSPVKSSSEEEQEGKLHLQAKCTSRSSAHPFLAPAKPKLGAFWEQLQNATRTKAHYCWFGPQATLHTQHHPDVTRPHL